jgi:hypothetical protein
MAAASQSKTPEESEGEIFTYLGLMSNVHFFFHALTGRISDGSVPLVCSQICNAMINETMIKAEQTVGVYAMGADGRIKLVHTTPAKFRRVVVLPAVAKTALQSLLKADRKEGEKMLVFKMHMVGSKPGPIFTYEIPAKNSILESLKGCGTAINGATASAIEVVHTLTTKVIPYL